MVPAIKKVLKCPICGNQQLDFSKVCYKRDYIGYILCKVCKNRFYFKNGILIANSPQTHKKNHWDRLYEGSVRIKGNFVSSINDVDKNIGKLISNANIAQAYLPMVKIIKDFFNYEINYSLEVGCGTGSYSIVLKKLGLISNVILLDSSYPALERAKHIFNRFNDFGIFILADGMNIPLLDKSVNLAFSAGLLEHFSKEQQKKLISEQTRISTHIICQIPINTLFYNFQRKVIELLNKGWPFGYEKPLSLRYIRELFNENKLIIEKITYRDAFTAFLFRLSVKYRCSNLFVRKQLFNKLFKSEAIVLAEQNQTDR